MCSSLNNDFSDAIERCMYKLNLYDELVNKRIAVLNDDLQLIWEGEITKDNANEKLDMIMKDGNKYLYVGDEE